LYFKCAVITGNASIAVSALIAAVLMGRLLWFAHLDSRRSMAGWCSEPQSKPRLRVQHLSTSMLFYLWVHTVCLVAIMPFYLYSLGWCGDVPHYDYTLLYWLGLANS